MGKIGLGVQNEAGQRLTEFCQENTVVIANTLFQKNKRRFYTWASLDSQCRYQIYYILCNQKWRSSIQSAKTRLGADCGSDHELLMPCYAESLHSCLILGDPTYSSPAQPSSGQQPQTAAQPSRLLCPQDSPGKTYAKFKL